MSNAIQDILETVFPGENVAPYAQRMEMLYGMVFQIADAEEHEQLKTEVVRCERLRADYTRREVEVCKELTPEMAVRMFCGVAFTMAKNRMETGEKLRCAHYMGDIFANLVNSELIPQALKQRYRKDISDALVDFNYASGFSDNLSFRMHAATE